MEYFLIIFHSIRYFYDSPKVFVTTGVTENNVVKVCAWLSFLRIVKMSERVLNTNISPFVFYFNTGVFIFSLICNFNIKTIFKIGLVEL